MALRIAGSAESDNYRPGGKFYRGPLLGQQQNEYSHTFIPTGGFAGQNQIGGQSKINIFRKNPTPEELEEQALRDRAEKYENNLYEYNLGQKEAELASLMGGGQSPTSLMGGGQNSTTPNTSIIDSIRGLQNNPSEFFSGGGDLGEVTNYLSQANQLFRASGQEGNLMDFVLGKRVYRPGTSYASQGFTPETAKASLGMELSTKDKMRQFNLDTFQRAAPGTNF